MLNGIKIKTYLFFTQIRTSKVGLFEIINRFDFLVTFTQIILFSKNSSFIGETQFVILALITD